jgi:hypothetical protein
MRRKAGLTALVGSFLLLLALGASLWCIAGKARSAEPPPRIAAEPTPGLIIQGHVWLHHEDGPGWAGVDIYRRYASYPGIVVATTDADGFYQSGFAYIPGDEMVTVWADLDRYTFLPEQYYWRHYYGYEVRTLNFVAAAYTCYLPLVLYGDGDTGGPEERYADRW